MPIPFAMNLDGALLQFGGSLIAILLLAGLAYWLGLGGNPEIESVERAGELAGEAVYGFAPVDCAIDAQGASALLADGAGRIMVLKRHGSQFAGRILNSSSSARLNGNQLVIKSGERRFGTVKLHIPNGEDWAHRIKGLKDTSDA